MFFLVGKDTVMDDTTRLLRSLAIDREAEPKGAAHGRTAREGRQRLILILTAALALASAISAWFALGPATKATPEITATQAEAAPTSALSSSLPVTASRPAGSLIASGYVVARRKAAIASEVTGKIVEIFVEEGMTVERGQVLARLDSVIVEKDLALAKARVEAVEAASAAIAADLNEAEHVHARVQTLSQENYSSVADLTKAEARVATLTAQLRQSSAQLEMSRLEVQRMAATLEKHQIRAPFAGVIIERNAQAGEMIALLAAGGFTRTGVCTIVDMASIEFEVEVNEAFIGRINQGARASAVLDAYPDLTIPASVVAIIPTANREKATVKVRLGLKEKDLRILPDMAVKVTFLEDVAVGITPQD